MTPEANTTALIPLLDPAVTHEEFTESGVIIVACEEMLDDPDTPMIGSFLAASRVKAAREMLEWAIRKAKYKARYSPPTWDGQCAKKALQSLCDELEGFVADHDEAVKGE